MTTFASGWSALKAAPQDNHKKGSKAENYAIFTYFWLYDVAAVIMSLVVGPFYYAN